MHGIWLDLLTLAVLAWIGSRLVVSARFSLRSDARARTMQIVRGLRLRHFAPVPLVLAGVLFTATVLTHVPVLSYGWWSALGGAGNPVFGVSETTAGTPFELLLPLMFLSLLVPALPLLVEREEVLFRLGAEAWSAPRRVMKALLFGLAHALIGIPVGVALALAIGGAWFTACYLRGYRMSGGSRAAALRESTRAHLAYNTTIVAAALGYLILITMLVWIGP